MLQNRRCVILNQNKKETFYTQVTWKEAHVNIELCTCREGNFTDRRVSENSSHGQWYRLAGMTVYAFNTAEIQC